MRRRVSLLNSTNGVLYLPKCPGLWNNSDMEVRAKTVFRQIHRDISQKAL